MTKKFLTSVTLPSADPTQPYEAVHKDYLERWVNLVVNSKMWTGTQAQFDAIATLDPNTYYYVVPG